MNGEMTSTERPCVTLLVLFTEKSHGSGPIHQANEISLNRIDYKNNARLVFIRTKPGLFFSTPLRKVVPVF